MPISQDYFQVPHEHMIGAFTDIHKDEGRFGPQIVVEFTPLGETTPRLKWYNADTAMSRRSEWQRLLKGLRAIGMETSSKENILNRPVKIVLVEKSFTTDDGEERIYDIWKPAKLYASEQEALEELAKEETEIPELTVEQVTKDLGGIPAEILTKARKTWLALEGDEDSFRSIAASSWPGMDVDALVKAVKA